MATKQIHPLTGLRWVAVMLVIMRHNSPPASESWHQFFANGHAGVTIFFVLSGFVIGINYASDLANPTNSKLKKYFVARFARIYPLYLVVLIGFGVLLGFDRPFIVLRHILMIQSWSSYNHVAYSMNAPAWSVGVEAFFYMMFPLIAWLGRSIFRRANAALVLFAFCAGFLIATAIWFSIQGLADLPETDVNSSWRWIYRNPALRLGDFVMGLSVAALYGTGWIRTKSDVLLRSAVWLSAFIMICFLFVLPVGSAFSLDAAFALPAAVFIGATSGEGGSMIERLLGSKPLVFLGEVSFAVYLVHKPIGDELFSGLFMYGLSLSELLRFFLLVSVVIFGATLLHFAVERPARKYIRGLLL